MSPSSSVAQLPMECLQVEPSLSARMETHPSQSPLWPRLALRGQPASPGKALS